jgi:hypothetical protein
VDFTEKARLNVVRSVAGKTYLLKMAFIHQDSCEYTKSKLDSSSMPPTQVSVDSETFVECHPISSLADGTSIKFEVSSTTEDYIDFANSYLYVRVKTKKADGKTLEASDNVGPVNNFLYVTQFLRLGIFSWVLSTMMSRPPMAIKEYCFWGFTSGNRLQSCY